METVKNAKLRRATGSEPRDMCLKILARVLRSALEKVGAAMAATVRNEAAVTVGGVAADVVRCKLKETKRLCRWTRTAAFVYAAHVLVFTRLTCHDASHVFA